MSLNDPSFDDRTDPPTGEKDGPSIVDRADSGTASPTAADRRRSRAAVQTENRLLRARAAALERELADSSERRRRVIDRYEALLSERRDDAGSDRATASDRSSPPAKLLAALRGRIARR
ncbi:hypothetical protein [Natronoarchaeum rubrum]|uniref:hypothetical protein n=1 Tax=Natronoarchaeum rubrum TaxID=755311 RepID=UPI0021118944|nr:hypothetical protein [Natronoarchaeum rubrum]HMB49150.1 hypothetical protein [Natronoarchaeum rubrum]